MQGAIEAEGYNCSCLCIIHSEPEDASRYFGITFTVIAVIILTIAIATVAMTFAINFIYKRFVPFRSLVKHYLSAV